MNLKYVTFLVILFLASCNKQVLHLADVEANRYQIDYSIDEKSSINKIIAPYKKELDSKMGRVIAYNAEQLVKDRPNSSMGNWFTDVLQEVALHYWEEETDFAFQNYGGLRLPAIGVGDIMVGTIYELMPFDNTLVQLKVDGATVHRLMNHIASYGGAPLSHNISFETDGNKATNILINDEPIKMNSTYYIAMPNYTADGGDRCDFLVDKPRDDSGVYIRDLMIDHFDRSEGIDTIKANMQSRIIPLK
jgi:2',3'-cyclic-nucleotide 2'-phosphodiesterase (5'-nucleotidase family)